MGKLKPQPDIISHPHRMSVMKEKIIQVLMRMWRNRNSYILLVGMQNGAATLKKFGNSLKC